jgi:hypothetical protein
MVLKETVSCRNKLIKLLRKYNSTTLLKKTTFDYIKINSLVKSFVKYNISFKKCEVATGPSTV